jgi:hypothetical protein
MSVKRIVALLEEDALLHRRRQTVLVVRCVRLAGEPVQDGERAHALGMGGRQQDARRRAVSRGEHRHLFHRGGVHHRQDVGHRLLERRHLARRQRIGQAEAPGVVQHEAAER